MAFFEPIEGSSVLLRKAGSYFASPLFTRNQVLYAKRGSNFIKLHPSENTSSKGTVWMELDLPRGCNAVTYKGELIYRGPTAKAAA